MNLLLFLGTRRFIPDLDTTPDFSTPRSAPTKGSSQVLFGVTPFTFAPSEQAAEEQPEMMTAASGKRHTDTSAIWYDGRLETETLCTDPSMESPTSITSYESQRPLNDSMRR